MPGCRAVPLVAKGRRRCSLRFPARLVEWARVLHHVRLHAPSADGALGTAESAAFSATGALSPDKSHAAVPRPAAPAHRGVSCTARAADTVPRQPQEIFMLS